MTQVGLIGWQARLFLPGRTPQQNSRLLAGIPIIAIQILISIAYVYYSAALLEAGKVQGPFPVLSKITQ